MEDDETTEVTPEAGGDDWGAGLAALGGETEPAAGESQEAPGEGVEAAETAAEEVAWALDRATFEQYTQNQDQLAQAFQSLLPYMPALDRVARLMNGEPQDTGEQGQALPEWDPFEPESVEKYIQGRIDRELGERLAPVEQYMDTQMEQVGLARADQILDGLAADPNIGDFDRGAAHLLADTLVTRMGRDPVSALTDAAAHLAQVEKAAEKRGEERYKQSLQAVGTAAREAGIGSGTAATEVVKPPTGSDWG